MNDIKAARMSMMPAAPQVTYQVPGCPVTITIIQGEGTPSRYQVNEPELAPGQQVKLDLLRDRLPGIFRDKTRYMQFSKNFSREFARMAEAAFPSLDGETVRILEYYIRRDARGFGPIQPLIDDPSVSVIFVKGPERNVTVTHTLYGSLSSSIVLSGDGILALLRKICNRSAKPVDITDLPKDLTLRSGHSVRLVLPDDGTIPMKFAIVKRSIQKKGAKNPTGETNSDVILSTYLLYHDKIEVRVSRNVSGKATYQISMVPLSQQEQSAIELAREENHRISGLSSFREGAFQFSKDDFSRVVARKFPDIPKDRLSLLYVAFSFSQDTVRWIRVILADRRVRRLLCIHPGRPVQVWHSSAPEGAETMVIPDRSDLNRFTDFLIRSSGMTIDPDSQEVSLRFRTGQLVSLTRIMDDQGHYYRIDIKKNGNNPSSSKTAVDTRKEGKSPTPPLLPEQPDPRIDKLLTKIFSQKRENPGETGSKEKEQEAIPSNRDGFIGRINSLVRGGIKGFSISSLRTTKPSADEAPVPEIPQVPSVLSVQTEDGYTAEEAYWLYQPHAYAVVLQDPSRDRSYRVVEPELSPRERIILEETHETLRDVLVYDKPVTKGDLFLEYGEVAKVVKSYDPKISTDRLSVLYYYLRRNLNGYGKIDALMYDELLEDISCNGHNLPVYIHHRYYGSIPTSIRFDSEELNRFVLKLSQKADKQVSLTSPLLDASLPNGARAQITYSDVISTKGSSFTIRKFRSDPMTPANLLAFGTYSDELLAFIWLALENRQSLIVVGGTASGKTSAMNAFSFFIPHNSKIVSLEDTREIQIPQKNWLPVQTRTSNSHNDRGSVDLFDLLKASLRQRPEYIIVGEVRGNEAQTLFQAMNSGHTTLSTLHAGNIEEALNRLTNEPINVPPAMFGALNLMVIQTFHYREGRMIRRCDAIHEIVLGDADKVGWNTLYEYEPKEDTFRKVFSSSKTLRTIQYMHNWSDEEIMYQINLRAGFLARLRNQYSTDPEVLIRMITDLRRLA